MYISLGGDTLIRNTDIIGIFDLDNTTQSKITKNFLSRAESENRLVSKVEDLPKSFILSDDGMAGRVELSVLTPATIVKRIN